MHTEAVPKLDSLFYFKILQEFFWSSRISETNNAIIKAMGGKHKANFIQRKETDTKIGLSIKKSHTIINNKSFQYNLKS